jgi:FkbM family methyltransferase
MQQFLIRGLRKLRLLKRLNLNFKRSVNRHSYSIPLVNGNGQQNFIVHEEWMQQVLEKLVKIKKGAFIDVGVNVGQTLLKIKSIDPGIRYYGFEPNPTCVYYLDQLIEMNGIRNAVIFPVAIAEKAGIAELNFYYDSDTDSAASMIKDFRPSAEVRKKVYIPCFSVKEMEQYIDVAAVSIIKIDVEGAEMEVLKGLNQFLETARPFVIMEILPVYNEQNNDRLQRQKEIENILAQHNYQILRIRKTADDHFSHLEKLNEVGIHSEQSWCDYIFCPKEILPGLIGSPSASL